MSHELDINAGRASFVSARTQVWHQLGTVLDDTFTAEQAMQDGLLGGWNVRMWDAYAVHPESGVLIPKPNRCDVVRDNPVTPGQVDFLGEVSSSYHVIQNEDHAGFLNALVDESGAHFDTAGAIQGGRRVFISMKMPDHIMVGGVDRVDTYLAAINDHSGNLSFTTMITPVRIVCQNTLNMAFRGAKHAYKVRHTSGAPGLMVNEARQALDMAFSYLGDFQAQAEQLINTTMTQTRFEEIVNAEFGPEEDSGAAARTRRANNVEQMIELFTEADTQEGIRDTAWAGLNALTEWADHCAPVRGSDRESARAVKSVLDPAWKNQALELMLQG